MRRFLQPMLVLAALPVSALAQDLGELCDELRAVKVGQWAEYSMIAPEMEPSSANMRFAIVGTEQADGQQHYWHETTAETPMGTMIAQMLVPGFPYDPSRVKRMVTKMGDQPAQDVPEAMLSMMRSQMGNNPAMSTVDRCGEGGDAEELGWETVSVPAGSYQALHIRSSELQAEWWISSDAPFGMVKFMGPEGQQVVLTGHGDGARSSLAGRP